MLGRCMPRGSESSQSRETFAGSGCAYKVNGAARRPAHETANAQRTACTAGLRLHLTRRVGRYNYADQRAVRVARNLLPVPNMKHLHLLLCGICAAWLVSACVLVEADAPTEPSSATTSSFADKVEIDPVGKISCDGGNEACFAADKVHCKEGDYTGACQCTHCEGGNVCEIKADHDAHDEKCKLKARAELVFDGS